VKINIISYEKPGWILYEYAKKLAEALLSLEEQVVLTFEPIAECDVTFHVNYLGLLNIATGGTHVSLVTHVDTPGKLHLVKAQAASNVKGLCMSYDTARRLRELTGVDAFWSITPPAMVSPLLNTKEVLIAGRTYPDGRKREAMLVEFAAKLTPQNFSFRIIGGGWAEQVSALLEMGFNVNWTEHFSRECYREALTSSEYLLVLGNDEGAISTLDALAFDVVPIVTAQGYHLDHASEVMMFSSDVQLIEIATSIDVLEGKRRAKKESLGNWVGFAREHVKLWKGFIMESTRKPEV